MESNDKAAPLETSPDQPVNDTEFMAEQGVSPDTTVAERHEVAGADDTAVVEQSAQEKRERIQTDETPFDRQPVKSDKIDWGGMGIAFFGGIGGNFFLALFIFSLQQMLGSAVYGPGVLAILTGLFVVMQLLIPLSAEVRRMTISFWTGLLFGYVLIAVLMAPYFAIEQK